MLSTRYRQLLAVAVVGTFFTSVDVYLFSTGILGDVPPLYWIAAYLGVASLILVLGRTRSDVVKKSGLAFWCCGFIAISGTWLFFQPSPPDTSWQEFRLRLLAALFLIITALIFSGRECQLWARRAILVAVLLNICINAYEMAAPGLFLQQVTGRGAALYVNPNQAGNALIVGMIFAAGVVPKRLRLLFLTAVLLGVVLTFSRSAIIAWCIITLLMLLTDEISIRKSLAVGVTGGAVAVVVLMAFWDEILLQLKNLGAVNADIIARINWFQDPGGADYSSVERQEIAKQAWKMFSESPVVGHGLGSTKNWDYLVSSHNQYLNFMVDHGVIGAFLLPLLVLAVTWGARGEAKKVGVMFAVFILFIGFFSHNVVDERYFLIGFSLMAAMTVSSKVEGREYEAQTA